MQARVEKLSLAPGDLIIVRDEADMATFLEMTQQGIGFAPHSNPVLLVQGGLEKASRQDLIEALAVLDKQQDAASRIITGLHMPRKVQ
jgi:hypothetical protein